MICISTRGNRSAGAVSRGAFSPASRPMAVSMFRRADRRSDEWWDALRGRPFQDVAVAMAHALVGDEFARGRI